MSFRPFSSSKKDKDKDKSKSKGKSSKLSSPVSPPIVTSAPASSSSAATSPVSPTLPSSPISPSSASASDTRHPKFSPEADRKPLVDVSAKPAGPGLLLGTSTYLRPRAHSLPLPPQDLPQSHAASAAAATIAIGQSAAVSHQSDALAVAPAVFTSPTSPTSPTFATGSSPTLRPTQPSPLSSPTTSSLGSFPSSTSPSPIATQSPTPTVPHRPRAATSTTRKSSPLNPHSISPGPSSVFPPSPLATSTTISATVAEDPGAIDTQNVQQQQQLNTPRRRSSSMRVSSSSSKSISPGPKSPHSPTSPSASSHLTSVGSNPSSPSLSTSLRIVTSVDSLAPAPSRPLSTSSPNTPPRGSASSLANSTGHAQGGTFAASASVFPGGIPLGGRGRAHSRSASTEQLRVMKELADIASVPSTPSTPTGQVGSGSGSDSRSHPQSPLTPGLSASNQPWSPSLLPSSSGSPSPGLGLVTTPTSSPRLVPSAVTTTAASVNNNPLGRSNSTGAAQPQASDSEHSPAPSTPSAMSIGSHIRNASPRTTPLYYHPGTHPPVAPLILDRSGPPSIGNASAAPSPILSHLSGGPSSAAPSPHSRLFVSVRRHSTAGTASSTSSPAGTPRLGFAGGPHRGSSGSTGGGGGSSGGSVIDSPMPAAPLQLQQQVQQQQPAYGTPLRSPLGGDAFSRPASTPPSPSSSVGSSGAASGSNQNMYRRSRLGSHDPTNASALAAAAAAAVAYSSSVPNSAGGGALGVKRASFSSVPDSVQWSGGGAVAGGGTPTRVTLDYATPDDLSDQDGSVHSAPDDFFAGGASFSMRSAANGGAQDSTASGGQAAGGFRSPSFSTVSSPRVLGQQRGSGSGSSALGIGGFSASYSGFNVGSNTWAGPGSALSSPTPSGYPRSSGGDSAALGLSSPIGLPGGMSPMLGFGMSPRVVGGARFAPPIDPSPMQEMPAPYFSGGSGLSSPMPSGARRHMQQQQYHEAMVMGEEHVTFAGGGRRYLDQDEEEAKALDWPRVPGPAFHAVAMLSTSVPPLPLPRGLEVHHDQQQQKRGRTRARTRRNRRSGRKQARAQQQEQQQFVYPAHLPGDYSPLVVEDVGSDYVEGGEWAEGEDEEGLDETPPQPVVRQRRSRAKTLAAAPSSDIRYAWTSSAGDDDHNSELQALMPPPMVPGLSESSESTFQGLDNPEGATGPSGLEPSSVGISSGNPFMPISMHMPMSVQSMLDLCTSPSDRRQQPQQHLQGRQQGRHGLDSPGHFISPPPPAPVPFPTNPPHFTLPPTRTNTFPNWGAGPSTDSPVLMPSMPGAMARDSSRGRSGSRHRPSALHTSFDPSMFLGSAPSPTLLPGWQPGISPMGDNSSLAGQVVLPPPVTMSHRHHQDQPPLPPHPSRPQMPTFHPPPHLQQQLQQQQQPQPPSPFHSSNARPQSQYASTPNPSTPNTATVAKGVATPRAGATFDDHESSNMSFLVRSRKAKAIKWKRTPRKWIDWIDEVRSRGREQEREREREQERERRASASTPPFPVPLDLSYLEGGLRTPQSSPLYPPTTGSSAALLRPTRTNSLTVHETVVDSSLQAPPQRPRSASFAGTSTGDVVSAAAVAAAQARAGATGSQGEQPGVSTEMYRTLSLNPSAPLAGNISPVSAGGSQQQLLVARESRRSSLSMSPARRRASSKDASPMRRLSVDNMRRMSLAGASTPLPPSPPPPPLPVSPLSAVAATSASEESVPPQDKGAVDSTLAIHSPSARSSPLSSTGTPPPNISPSPRTPAAVSTTASSPLELSSHSTFSHLGLIPGGSPSINELNVPIDNDNIAPAAATPPAMRASGSTLQRSCGSTSTRFSGSTGNVRSESSTSTSRNASGSSLALDPQLSSSSSAGAIPSLILSPDNSQPNSVRTSQEDDPSHGLTQPLGLSSSSSTPAPLPSTPAPSPSQKQQHPQQGGGGFDWLSRVKSQFDYFSETKAQSNKVLAVSIDELSKQVEYELRSNPGGQVGPTPILQGLMQLTTLAQAIVDAPARHLYDRPEVCMAMVQRMHELQRSLNLGNDYLGHTVRHMVIAAGSLTRFLEYNIACTKRAEQLERKSARLKRRSAGDFDLALVDLHFPQSNSNSGSTMSSTGSGHSTPSSSATTTGSTCSSEEGSEEDEEEADTSGLHERDVRSGGGSDAASVGSASETVSSRAKTPSRSAAHGDRVVDDGVDNGYADDEAEAEDEGAGVVARPAATSASTAAHSPPVQAAADATDEVKDPSRPRPATAPELLEQESMAQSPPVPPTPAQARPDEAWTANENLFHASIDAASTEQVFDPPPLPHAQTKSTDRKAVFVFEMYLDGRMRSMSPMFAKIAMWNQPNPPSRISELEGFAIVDERLFVEAMQRLFVSSQVDDHASATVQFTLQQGERQVTMEAKGVVVVDFTGMEDPYAVWVATQDVPTVLCNVCERRVLNFLFPDHTTMCANVHKIENLVTIAHDNLRTLRSEFAQYLENSEESVFARELIQLLDDALAIRPYVDDYNCNVPVAVTPIPLNEHGELATDNLPILHEQCPLWVSPRIFQIGEPPALDDEYWRSSYVAVYRCVKDCISLNNQLLEARQVQYVTLKEEHALEGSHVVPPLPDHVPNRRRSRSRHSRSRSRTRTTMSRRGSREHDVRPETAPAGLIDPSSSSAALAEPKLKRSKTKRRRRPPNLEIAPHGSRVAASSASPLSPKHAGHKTTVTLRDFEVLKPISRGAFGSVYLARRNVSGELCAIKVLRKADMVAKNQVANVKSEQLLLMMQDDSPFVTRFVATFETPDMLCLVMEYMNGGDCAALLKAVGCLPEEWAKTYIAEMVLILEYLHEKRGIIHRDLKPDNFLIHQSGHLKLTDFGLSRIGFLGRRGHSNITLPPPTLPSSPMVHIKTPMSDSRDSGSENLALPVNPLLTNYILHSRRGSVVGGPDAAMRASSANLEASPNSEPFHHSLTSGHNSLRGSTSNLPSSSGLSAPSSNLGPARSAPLVASPSTDSPHSGPATPETGGTGASTPQSREEPPASEASPNQPRTFVGTPDYLAPESILGIGKDDATVDWWALGVILYEFLYGIPPFHGESIEEVFENIIGHKLELSEELDPDITPEARDLIAKLLNPDPEKRLGARGAAEVKAHPFFDDIDWDGHMSLTPNFIPQPSTIDDTEYFDSRGAEEFEFPGMPSPSPKVQESRKGSVDSTSRPSIGGLSEHSSSGGGSGTRLRRTRTRGRNREREASGSSNDPRAAADFGNLSYRNVRLLEEQNLTQLQKLSSERTKTITGSLSILSTPSGSCSSLPAVLPPQAIKSINSPRQRSRSTSLTQQRPRISMISTALNSTPRLTPAAASDVPSSPLTEGGGSVDSDSSVGPMSGTETPGATRPINITIPSPTVGSAPRFVGQSPPRAGFMNPPTAPITPLHRSLLAGRQRTLSLSSVTSSGPRSSGFATEPMSSDSEMMPLPMGARAADVIGSGLASGSGSMDASSSLPSTPRSGSILAQGDMMSVLSTDDAKSNDSVSGSPTASLPRQGLLGIGISDSPAPQSSVPTSPVVPLYSGSPTSPSGPLAPLLGSSPVVQGASRADTAGSNSSNSRRRSDRPIRVLVADDNPIACKILETILRRLGAQCFVVYNGAEAVRLATGSVVFDLIFLDAGMPYLDGERAAQMIRATDNVNRNTVIVGVTGYDPSQLNQRFFNAIYQKMITKNQVVELFEKFGIGNSPPNS